MTRELTPKQNDFMQEAILQFRDLGFSRAPNPDGTQLLSRPIDIGEQWIHFSFSETFLKINITVNIGMTCNVIEDLLAELSGTPHVEGDSRVGTLGTDLGRLVQKRPPDWVIFRDGLAIETCADIKQAFKIYALPILDQIITLNDVFVTLVSGNRALPEQGLSNPTELGRAKRALATSFLLSNDLFDTTRKTETSKLIYSGDREELMILGNMLDGYKTS